jgi:gamma-glutamyltranspeptidase
VFVGSEGALTVERGLEDAVPALRALGHEVWDVLGEYSDNMGHASAIEVGENGHLVGGGDPRADSAAVGV